MMKLKTYYIALGSNKGYRFINLQNAVDAIYKRIGAIKLISSIYISPALGFNTKVPIEDFLNCCLVLESALEPQVVLDELLAIETALGRTRTLLHTYEARVIDLDVIFVDNNTINTETLQVPHPEMHKRKFVLLPLNDVAPHIKHPKLNKDVALLLAECSDNSILEAFNGVLINPCVVYDFAKYNYIAVEGNIGAGKTSLATKISQDFNAKLILEQFAENPFLPKFYEDTKRHAFTLEMSFLADRYKQISDDLGQLDVLTDFIVCDYDVVKSLVFSRITLNDDEVNLYQKFFDILFKDVVKPDLFVYLYQNTARLQENIKKRGRDFEQNITNDYLDEINAGYLNFLKTQTEMQVKIIDVSNRDFVQNRSDYLWLLDVLFV